MGQTDQERQAMNAWKATVSAKVRKDVLKDKADELDKQRDAKKRKALVESELGKRIRTMWKQFSKEEKAAWAPAEAAGEITEKDLGYSDHALNVYKTVTRDRVREKARAANPDANAAEIHKLVAREARDEFKALPPKQRFALELAPKVGRQFSVDGRFASSKGDLDEYLASNGLGHLLSDTGCLAEVVGEDLDGDGGGDLGDDACSESAEGSPGPKISDPSGVASRIVVGLEREDASVGATIDKLQLVIKKITKGGPIDLHNKEHPDNAVLVGDKIEVVDGRSVWTHDGVVAALHSKKGAVIVEFSRAVAGGDGATVGGVVDGDCLAPVVGKPDGPTTLVGKVAPQESPLSSTQRTPFAQLSSGGGGRKGRRQRCAEARAALDHAKGDMGGPEDVLHLLEGVLHEDEWDLLAKRAVDKARNEDVGPLSWQLFGQSCAKALQQHGDGQWRWPCLVSAVAAKQAGCKSRSRMKQAFGFQVSRSVWRLADDEGACLAERRFKTTNGRLGYRKVDPAVVAQILDEHSAETCKFGLRKGSLDDKDAGQDAYQIRSLSSTATAIHKSTDNLFTCISERTFRRYVQRDHPKYRTTGRKLDCCEKCLAWDRKVSFLIRTTLVEVVDGLVAVWPSYFDRWKESHLDPTDPAFDISGDGLRELCNHMYSHGTWDNRSSAEGVDRYDLHDAEAAAIRQLNVKWDKIRDPDEDDEQDEQDKGDATPPPPPEHDRREFLVWVAFRLQR